MLVRTSHLVLDSSLKSPRSTVPYTLYEALDPMVKSSFRSKLSDYRMIRSFVKNLFSSLPILKGIWDTQTSIPKTPNLEHSPVSTVEGFRNKGTQTHLLNFQLTEIWNLNKKNMEILLYQNRFIKQVLHQLVRWFVPIFPISFSHLGTNGVVISRVPMVFRRSQITMVRRPTLSGNMPFLWAISCSIQASYVADLVKWSFHDNSQTTGN